MKDILTQRNHWKEEKRKFVLATVAKVTGSAPRPLGSTMIISSEGEIAGSVSGGCVEGAVVELALESLKTGKPVLVSFGIQNQSAWEVGLACGGQIEVFVQPNLENDSTHEAFCNAVQKGQTAALATVLNGSAIGEHRLLLKNGTYQGRISDPLVQDTLDECLETSLKELKPKRNRIEVRDKIWEILLEVAGPKPRLVIVGAVHIADPLVQLAKVMGFHTIVVDARRAFATRERFPHADELVIAWPADFLEQMEIDENTAIIALTHDDKLDVPALEVALNSPARYIGVLGSTRTHTKRVQALLQDGTSPEAIQRIHAPVGIYLGGHSVEDLALSILAQIVAQKNGLQTLKKSAPEITP